MSCLCACGCGGEVRKTGHRFIYQHHTGASRPEYLVESDGGCWIWQRAKNRKGYGISRGRLAHCVIYERLRGAIPEDKELDHLCRNRACVNPDHMEAVTHVENVRRSANAKLTQADARWVRTFYEMGFRNVDIAEMYGISPGTVSNIGLGRQRREA